VYRDPQLATRRAILKLNNAEGFAYPTTLLVDQNGVIRSIWVGYSPGIGERMHGEIAELLAATKGSAP
jgi:hypothetical protein